MRRLCCPVMLIACLVLAGCGGGSSSSSTTSTSAHRHASEEPLQSRNIKGEDPTTEAATDAHIFSAFHSGQIVLADLDLWARLREQAQMVKEAREAALSAGVGGGGGERSRTQAWRAELAQRVLRLRVGTDVLRESL